MLNLCQFVAKLVVKFPIMILFPFIFQASIGSATDKGYIVSILSQIDLNSIFAFLSFICFGLTCLCECFVLTLKQSTLICPSLELSFHVEREFSFMFQSFIEFLSSCPFQPKPPSASENQLSQSNNSPDKFNIAPHRQDVWGKK